MRAVQSYHTVDAGIMFFVYNPIAKAVQKVTHPVTWEQAESWTAGAFIQDAMPQLSVDEREFLMSGIPGDAFDALFADAE